MISLTVTIKNLSQLHDAFRRAPANTLKWLARATQASIFEVEKQAVDANFRFKWPRSMRTGYLALSFAYGRQIAPSGLRASIGPTANYAPHVYWGTFRQAANPYMDRIAKAAEPHVNKHFDDAVDRIVSDLAV